MLNPIRLDLDDLLQHARSSARTDELPLESDKCGVKPAQYSPQTLRGWGNAALVELEWNSRCVYPPAHHREYRLAYAEEFERARTGRVTLWHATQEVASA